MIKSEKKEKVTSSLLWKLFETVGDRGISFVVQLVIARILIPADYGIIAIVAIFTNIIKIVVQSGFNKALIQKKDATDADFSSALILSLIMAIVGYLIIFFTAPFAAKYFENEIISPVMRVMSISIFLSAFNSIQNAYAVRQFKFKLIFIRTMIAHIISGAVGIFAAVKGMGVWALVIQQMVSSVVIIIIMWFSVKWRPKLILSKESLRSLYKFGGKLLGSSIIIEIFNEIRSFIIGKRFSNEMLAYYQRGRSIPALIDSTISGTLQSVMFPVLARHQDQRNELKSNLRMTIKSICFLLIPALVGFAVIAESLTRLVLTEKWIESVPFFQMFCFLFLLRPLLGLSWQGILAIGKSALYLKTQIIMKILNVIVILITMQFNVYILVAGELFTEIVYFIFTAFLTKRTLNYKYSEQLEDFLPAVIMSLVMGASIIWVNFLNLNDIFKLLIQIPLGVIVYFGLAIITKNKALNLLITQFKNLLGKRKPASQNENNSQTNQEDNPIESSLVEDIIDNYEE